AATVKVSDLWRWDGAVDRGPYAVIGLVGFAIKHNLDRAVASLVFDRHWELFNYYIPPGQALRITSLPRQEAVFFAAMVAISLPFIWVGVALTLRRLRSAGLPTWLVVCFFLPVLNLLFFLLLCVIPARDHALDAAALRAGRMNRTLARIIPESPLGSAAMAILLVLPFSIAAVLLGVSVFAEYGWGLFVALPFSVALAAVLLYGFHRQRSFLACEGVASCAVILSGVALAALAIEGVVCILMAAPLGLMLAWMGGAVGYAIQRRPSLPREAPAMLALLLLFAPGTMSVEHLQPGQPPLVALATSIEVAAPPKVVWRHAVSFAQLPEPDDWLFHTGIAYPTRATMYGSGAGAVRHCTLSTGSFVEPIEIWDAPRRLAFAVTMQPAPMQEWTPYEHIDPAHLHGYLSSERGEFLLTALPGGRTHLQGTTWYRNHMWPSAYWQLWSDFVIHRIHGRVLRHVKQLAEQQALPAPGR
ncbi:MAG: DUF805 domain-containing protein, partial [Terriglobales bacterium]